MNTFDYKIMIEQFLDGELDKKKEPVLFEILAHDEECREYFRNLNRIKKANLELIEDFPDELEDRIFQSIKRVEDRKNQKRPGINWFALIPYAVGVVLAVLSIYFYAEANTYKVQRDQAVNIIFKQEEEIEMYLFKSLPEIKVTSENKNPYSRGL